MKDAEEKWKPSIYCPFPSYDIIRSPYEGDCSIFWECYNGARYVMTCPTGLEYNQYEYRCDAPEIALCNKDATVSYDTYPHEEADDGSNIDTGDSTSELDPLCPYPSEVLTFFPNPDECTSFFQCYQGKKGTVKCPANLYWNINYNYCDYLENVDCSKNVLPVDPVEPVDPVNPADPEPSPGDSTNELDPLCPYPSEVLTFYPNPDDCTSFYQCYQGKKGTLKCPSNLYWNIDYNVCDYQVNVDCSKNILPVDPVDPVDPVNPVDPVEPEPAPASLCENHADGSFVADPSDCHKFLECVEGKAIGLVCPANLLWHQEILACDYATNVVKNEMHYIPSAEPEISVPVLEVFTPDPLCPYPSDNITFFPYPGNCSQYWECYEGTKFLMNCSAELYWDNVLQTCNRESEVNCTDVLEAFTPDPLCPYPSDNITFFPYPGNCSQYWECYEGTKFLMNCSAELYWDNVLQTCNRESEVDCTDISADWTPDPLCPYPSDDITFFPYLGDCTPYWETRGTNT
ncbi:hypothetical protein NQ318_004320 [Aromia moschata]|uniref:Chitin-binding type-2 domain-containing protein n=1 Tax=Aromia moschata TaxID=1265417 RepID=A0AAV8YTP1_9CUCU|nr:hypothetical protein NQ318_004320 [Aromia moschata]